MEHLYPKRRWEALRKISQEKSLGILLTHPLLVESFTGIQSANIAMLQDGERASLLTDPRYASKITQICREAPGDWGSVDHKSFLEMLKGVAIDNRILVDEMRTSYFWLKEFEPRELLDGGRAIKLASGLLEDSEIQVLQKLIPEFRTRAQQIIESHLQTGVTENHLAWILERELRDQIPNRGMAFDVIVAFGGNTAFPHHHPTGKALTDESPYLCDVGIRHISGVCTDMTFSGWHGRKPEASWQKDYDRVQEALEVSEAALEIGASCQELARKAEEALGEAMIHSLGHGVGQEVHTGVTINKRSKDLIAPHTSVTLEPALYREGRHGIRLEKQYLC